jgi:hypothetical protein
VPRAKQWRGTQNRGTHQVENTTEGLFEYRPKFFQFAAIICHVAVKLIGVLWSDFTDLCSHSFRIGIGVDLATRSESETILRIESGHWDLSPEISSHRLENLLKNPWIQKKRWAGVESKTVNLDR